MKQEKSAASGAEPLKDETAAAGRLADDSLQPPAPAEAAA